MKQDEINKKQMEVHHANKDAINEKRRANRYVCECGMTINKEYTSRHIKTARHIKLISCPPYLPCPPSPQSLLGKRPLVLMAGVDNKACWSMYWPVLRSMPMKMPACKVLPSKMPFKGS